MPLQQSDQFKGQLSPTDQSLINDLRSASENCATERSSSEAITASAALISGSRGLDRLMGEHADAVYDFVLYRVGHRRELAEDITQETLLTAVQGINGFHGCSALRTWLLGIAKNKVREALRSQSRMRPLGDLLLDADDEIFATLGRIAAEPIPDEVLERKETQSLVGATLSSLPDSYRTALTEHYIDGHSVPETAGRQGRGVKAAESTLHRAKRAFAEVFRLLSVRASGKEGTR